MPLTEPAANRDPRREPSQARLPGGTRGRQEIIAAHDRALAAGDPGYLDPGTGLFVLTADYLLERGFCCRRGCRHCPYTP